jgi:tetratricopeptide (TPR) repeat protein
MKDYTMALTYHQKGIEIREKKLPKNHCDLAVVYHNLAKLYLATREYSTAMKNVQQTLEIAQEKLPQNHPHLIDYRETFENISKEFVTFL